MSDYEFKEAWVILIIMLLLVGAVLGWGAAWIFQHVSIEVKL